MTIINSLSSLINGLNAQANRVNKATDDIQKSFVAAQNAQAADSVSVSDTASAAPLVENTMRNAALPTEGDVSAAVVDLLQAKFAYTADVRATQVTADVMRDTVNMLGKRES